MKPPPYLCIISKGCKLLINSCKDQRVLKEACLRKAGSGRAEIIPKEPGQVMLPRERVLQLCLGLATGLTCKKYREFSSWQNKFKLISE